jgi:hypothetical protein
VNKMLNTKKLREMTTRKIWLTLPLTSVGHSDTECNCRELSYVKDDLMDVAWMDQRLYKAAISTSEVTSRRMIRDDSIRYIQNDWGNKRSWHILKSIPAFAWRD